MKHSVIIMLAAAMVLLAGCKGSDNVKLKNHTDSVSWALGENTAIGLKQMGVEYNEEMVLRALRHTMKGKQQPFDDNTYRQLLASIALSMQQSYQEQAQRQAASASEKEEQRIAEIIANDPEIKKAEGGYYYKVIKKGSGPNVKKGEVAVFDYKGFTLYDKPIDQTYGVREPIEHVIGSPMFEGLMMGLTQMNAGSISRFYFPSALAFGAKGTEDIPPYTGLIYEVELHSFHK